MSEQQNNSPRQAAVNALISWAKAGWGYYSMRDAVDNYLESCGANRPSIGGEETILAHRKIAANRLAIDCIYALSKEELSKVDRELEGIVSNAPRQSNLQVLTVCSVVLIIVKHRYVILTVVFGNHKPDRLLGCLVESVHGSHLINILRDFLRWIFQLFFCVF